jgi:hypothetical protein
MASWGEAIGKLSQWIPTRRESLNNTIDKLKQEMQDVQNKLPFDAIKYQKLQQQLINAETLERRSS